MAYRVEKEGLTIVIDTLEELQAFLSVENNAPAVAQKSDSDTTDVKSESKTNTPISSEELVRKMTTIKGTPAADILNFLFNQPDHIATDAELKEHLGGENGSLGPRLANLSKVLKNANIEKETVFQRKEKRLARGKLMYWYKVTPQAVEAIRSIGDFDQEPTDSELFIRPDDF